MRHFTVSFKPDNKQISIHGGATITEAAGLAGIILDTICGGKGTCRKCLVNIEPGQKQVLACQYTIQSDITVTIPDNSRFFKQKILAEGIDTKKRVLPDIYKKYSKAGTDEKIFGLAVDVGTTTVVAKLIDMTDGKILAIQSAVNPQTQFGDDVVSRITYADTEENLLELQKVIIDCVNDLIGQLCEQLSFDRNDIYEMSVVGNTTMNHIFLNLPIIQLGQAPYNAYSVEAHDLLPEKLSLQINAAGNIHTVENIAGFVGADTTAVALAVDIESAEQMTLVVDIGTNGELVLGTKDKLYSASCAAGPALEGARITCGSRAAEGSIEGVVINEGDIDLDVIGDGEPRSICGSGLIDSVAVMLELGIIDATGRFVEAEELKSKVSDKVIARITEHNGQPAFVLSEKTNIFLSQKDIREMQLAKAAIRAGIKLLQKQFGIEDSDIEHIFLAGAFGNYIRRESALRIGLLPEIPAERIIFVGNAASSGAQMTLLSSQAREQACQLARKIEYIEIAHEPEFTTVYADSMMF